MKKIKYKNSFKSAFSLAEVLIALIIVTAFMVVMAPGITKRVKTKNKESLTFIYQYQDYAANKSGKPLRCYASGVGSAVSFSQTTNCSIYEFTVPENVYYINATLVAGGGGGGSSGSQSDSSVALKNSVKNYINPDNNYTTTVTASYSGSGNELFLPDFTNAIRIGYLAAKGKDGESAGTAVNSSNVVNLTHGGKGGDSSPLILNHDIPKEYMFGRNYKALLDWQQNINTQATITLGRESDGSMYVAFTNASNGGSTSTNEIKYRIDASSLAAYCVVGGSSYSYGTTTFNDYCHVLYDNYYPSVPGGGGEKAKQYTEGWGRASGQIIKGGPGGRTVAYMGAGSGGTGQDAVVLGTYCNTNGYVSHHVNNYYCQNFTTATMSTSTQGQNGGVLIERNSMGMGTPGGGGAPGTFARLLAIPVTPGEKLYIYVGGGGKGGVASPSNRGYSIGSDGVGGVSSAIARGSELMYLVTGGNAGGRGGILQYTGTKPTNVISDYKNRFGLTGRNFAYIFAGSQDYLNAMHIDDTLMTTAAITSGASLTSYGRILKYPLFDNEPYKTFIQNTVDRSSWDGKYGGYTISSVNGTSPRIQNSRYDGLYPRVLINNYLAAYIGGGGGLSLTDGSASCPPYFMGNFDGRTDSAGNYTNATYKNTFTLSNNQYYDINKYFTHCNVSSPNAEEFEIVLPNVLERDYGSAGNGGSGGGFINTQRSGNGANGTPGYVVLDWTR